MNKVFAFLKQYHLMLLLLLSVILMYFYLERCKCDSEKMENEPAVTEAPMFKIFNGELVLA